MTRQDADTFLQDRARAFDEVIGLIEAHIQSIVPPVLLSVEDLSAQETQLVSEREAWSLFLSGILHLKDGAPERQPGSIPGALTRASLRSSAIAAALGVRPPVFEPVYVSIDGKTGKDCAMLFCRRLVEGAESDLVKSRKILRQRMAMEHPQLKGDHAHAVKRQMAFSLNILSESYAAAASSLRASF